MNQVVGTAAETRAAQYLEAQGLQLVAQQVRMRTGELDLVMRDGSAWVFVEVKARRSQSFGGGLAAVTRSKQHKVRRTAEGYLQRQQASQHPCRFDVVEVNLGTDDITWIRNAF